MAKAFTLARWFTNPVQANGPASKFTREDVLHEVYKADKIGVRDGVVIARCPKGVAIIETTVVQGAKLVEFDYVEDNRWARTTFWMNASSVKDLGNILRGLPRASFDDLFVYGETAR